MGRRPNAVVAEYFVRGEKLGDSSNRYSHTCRGCGEYFAKGRVDGLIAHLLRRCSAVSQQDKSLILRVIQQGNSEISRGILDKHLHEEPSVLGPEQDNAAGGDSLEPSDVPREQSALDTLAEVSRRHLDYSTQHRTFETPFDRYGAPPRLDGIGSLAEQLQRAAATSDIPPVPGELTRVAYEVPADSLESAPRRPTLNKPHEAQDNIAECVSRQMPPSAAEKVLPLVQTASAANQQLEQDAVPGPEADLEPRLHDLDMHTEHQADPVQVGVEIQEMTWSPVIAPNSHTFETLVAYPSHSSCGVLRKGGRTRVRGRFQDDRRKEVQQIRKQGACMRCRMLKKPCSEGTPCKTCQGVESARLWKGKCLRTRLVDEFLLWRIGLFHSRGQIRVPAAIQGLESLALHGRIEVRLCQESNICMTFAPRRYVSELVHSQSGAVERRANGHSKDSSSPEIWLLDRLEAITTKIELYANRIANICITRETSKFLQATLNHTQAMVESQTAEAQPMNTSQTTRSCYNIQNHLLENVLELWVQTTILTSIEPDTIQLRYNARQPPEPLLTTTDWSVKDAIGTNHYQCLPKHSEELIRAQLMAGVEARCHALSKTIINEIERRLLQRQQVSRFSTFLSAIILLSCVERTTGVYRAVEKAAAPSEATSQHDLSGQGADSRRPPDWPLDKLPHELWRQGEYFADLLITLLRMRALPPKTSIDAEHKLIIAPDDTTSNLPGKTTAGQIDEDINLPSTWLDPIGLSVTDLIQIRDGGLPGPEDNVKAWDLTFISRLLLPQISSM